MNEFVEANAAADDSVPKNKGGWPKGKKRGVRKAAVAPAAGNIFEGLTERTCCDGCSRNRCIITHEDICGTPALGLQAKYQMMPDVVKRYRAAHKYLDMKKAERRSDQR